MVILDIETSDLIPSKGSLLSIGAVDFDNPTNTFYGECRVWEGANLLPDSMQVTGFTQEQVTDPTKQTTTDLLRKFLNWLSVITDQTLAGQNVHWDIEFLRAELIRSGITDVRLGHRIVDLHSTTYTKMLELKMPIPLKNNRTDINLDYELEFCGIDRRVGAHNALEDSLLEAECLSRLLFGQNRIEEYKQFEIPIYLRK